MKSVVVGTAGHIDHGKTALVKALTGIDADRLEEEKRRGITIDIGFAHLELPSPSGEALRLGFVDVPGHERFVRNMLAGIGGIDLVLLVIAADESIKPQTREHFEICRLLNIQRGMTVLTKSDAVDAETLEVVRLEIEEFVRGSFLQGAPILPASSITGVGLDAVKRELARIASEVPAKDSNAIFRLPIDRVFTMKGHGTVVTGTLLSGRVRKDEEVEVHPRGERLRVRAVQVHNSPADEAVAGQRTALNLASTATEELARGMTLATPGLFRPTTRVDVSLTLLPGVKRLKDRARVHLHVHTAEVIAEVVLYPPPTVQVDEAGAEETPSPSLQALAPGATAFAQLRLSEPLLLLPGDRFIVRQFSPVVTIGGGVVVDALPRRLRMSDALERAARLTTLSVLANGTADKILVARVVRRNAAGLSMADAIAETGWTPEYLEDVIRQRLITPDQLSLFRNPDVLVEFRLLRFGDLLVTHTTVAAAMNDLLSTLSDFHASNPLVRGMSKEELRDKLDIPLELFAAVLDLLVREKKVEVDADQVRLAGRGVVMKDEEAESQEQIEQAFSSAGLKVPALKEVLAGLKVDRVRAQKIVTLLLRDRVLVKVSEDLVFHRHALDELKRMLAAAKAHSPQIDVAKFKDMTGVSRKYAIPLLEYLDRERVTRRVGDSRVIL